MTGDRSLRTLVADAAEAIESSGQIIGYSAGSTARYELFHAPNSICAHKVRSVLAFHHIPYVSHPLNLFQGQTYLPAYVRLRMDGKRMQGLRGKQLAGESLLRKTPVEVARNVVNQHPNKNQDPDS